MRFVPIGTSDARMIFPVRHEDERGSFARSWCAKSFAEANIEFVPVQGNSSFTHRRHSVRGMHFQREPKPDAKIVRCSAGRIHDVIVDLRSSSENRGKVYVNELSAEGGQLLYIPAGFAHGFQTLTDDVVVEYLMGEEYVRELADGFRHDDPAIPIEWPEPISLISKADQSWPNLAGRVDWLSPASTDGE